MTNKIQTYKQRVPYSQPEVEFLEVKTECGFASSIENIGKDEEVEF